MARFDRLENVLPDFDEYPGSHDESFEDDFLKPRLKTLHPEATLIRFCGGDRGYAGSYTNRTVQIWVNRTLTKSYKYGG